MPSVVFMPRHDAALLAREEVAGQPRRVATV